MASTYLNKTFGTPTSTQKCTHSFWFKLGSDFTEINFSGMWDNYYSFDIVLDSSSRFRVYSDNTTPTKAIEYVTNRVLRDPSAWYHAVVSIDTTQSGGNRVKIYINGVQETSFATTFEPNQNDSVNIVLGTHSAETSIGRTPAGGGGNYFDGSITHYHYVDGTAYDADTFGETDATTGIWKPKTAPSVTYGNNGFFLKFENSGAFGTDSSGNGNTFTVNGTMTQNIDTPSNVFVTINALTLSASQYTLANGNLSTNGNGSNAWRSIFSTLGVTQGKYYFEMKVNAIEASDLNNFALGICDIEQIGVSASNGKFFGTSRGYGYHAKDGKKLNNDSVTANGVAYGSSWTTNDIIGCAFDLDNGKLYWSKNGTWQNSGDPESGATGTGSAFDVTTGYTYVPVLANYYSAEKVSFNFGNGYFGTTAVSSAQNPDDGIGIFEYDVPTGYRALCTKSINAEEYS